MNRQETSLELGLLIDFVKWMGNDRSSSRTTTSLTIPLKCHAVTVAVTVEKRAGAI